MILQVTDAKYLKGYKVQLVFNNAREGTADLSDSLDGPVFEPLKDEVYFAQLKLNQVLGTISWPNGVDLAPEYLFFLAFKDDLELQDQFQRWGYITAEQIAQH